MLYIVIKPLITLDNFPKISHKRLNLQARFLTVSYAIKHNVLYHLNKGTGFYLGLNDYAGWVTLSTKISTKMLLVFLSHSSVGRLVGEMSGRSGTTVYRDQNLGRDPSFEEEVGP